MNKKRLTIKKTEILSKSEMLAKAQAPKPVAKSSRVFGGVIMTQEGRDSVKNAHYQFERFWQRIESMVCAEEDKKECLDRLKEACFWMCRGISRVTEKPWEPKVVEEGEKKEETAVS